jgi:hypothetical protein
MKQGERRSTSSRRALINANRASGSRMRAVRRLGLLR